MRLQSHESVRRAALAVVCAFALPAFASTISVSSSSMPSPILEPGQELTYSGPTTNATLWQSFTLGAIQDEANVSITTASSSLHLTFNDTSDGNSPVFNFTFTSPGSGTGGTLTFIGTGAPVNINGLTYATITEGVFTYGVQQTVDINAGKGTFVAGIITSSVPEPATCAATGLALLALAVIAWRRRAIRD